MDSDLIIRNVVSFIRKYYLRYVIANNEITMSPRHIQAIRDFPAPKSVHDLRFLGLANYFRKFIKDYSVKAKPLYNLLKKTVKFNVLSSIRIIKKGTYLVSGFVLL